MDDPRTVPGYSEFKLNVLGDAAEDAYWIGSPLGFLRGNVRDFIPLPPLSEEEHRALAEAVLRDLFEEGLIRFFHNASDSLTADAFDGSLVLSPAEAEAAIASDAWRIPYGETDVHFTITEKGEQANFKS